MGRNPKLCREELKALPMDCPITEHGYMLFLARKWERLEENIDQLKAEQQKLFDEAQNFRREYQALTKA